MKIDIGIDSDPFRIGQAAQRAEKIGYNGVQVAETNRDPFIPLTIAADRTKRIELMTSVVVAFARNPMSLAMQAHELNVFSDQRLVLGIGSQVKPHIERRFSMPWYKPAKQMREFIEAMFAIFACWYRRERLNYEGTYYQLNLMPSTFTPPVRDVERPRLILSATGPLMTNVAAEVADGMIAHPFSSLAYLKGVTLPAIDQGLENSGRQREDFQLHYAPMLAIADNEELLVKQIANVKHRIAFYGCTVAYRPVLEYHGWDDLQDELIRLNRQHRKQEMADLITDEILQAIAIVGTPEFVIEELNTRLSGIAERTSFHCPGIEDERLTELLSRFNDRDTNV